MISLERMRVARALANLSHVGEVGRGDLALELDGETGIAGGRDGEIALLDEAELLGRLDSLHDGAVDGALGDLRPGAG